MTEGFFLYITIAASALIFGINIMKAEEPVRASSPTYRDIPVSSGTQDWLFEDRVFSI